MCSGKASSADNGHSLGKGDNTGRAHARGSHRAGREGVIHFVALLGKAKEYILVAIPGETRLAVNPFPTR